MASIQFNSLFGVLFVAVWAFPFAGNVPAQELATLRITVQDASGGVLPGASVTVTHKETGAGRAAIANEEGLAVIPSLRAGAYEATVEAPSFQSRTLNLQLSVGQTASMSVTLGIEVQQAVEVSATAETLDPQKPEISQLIDERKIEDLPIQGRQFIDFVVLTPGAVVGQSTSASNQSPFQETVLKLSFSGVRETHTVFMALDGVDYTMALSGVQRTSPSQDWVQEFRVANHPYTADTGRSFGNVVNTVTKSGTNEFHGTAYEFFRNDELNAKNILSRPGFDALRFNQFGVTLGGPLRREQTFFFGGYEGQRRAESPIYSDFILQAIHGINGVKQFFGLSREDLASVLQVEDFDKFLIRVDHEFSNTALLNTRYIFADLNYEDVLGAPPGLGLPSTFRHSPQRDQTFNATLLNVLSPVLTLETSGQYGRRTVVLEPVGAGLEPSLQLPNLFSSGSIVGSVPFFREQRAAFEEDVNYARGDHSLRLGGEFHQVINDVRAPMLVPGLAIFSPESFFAQGPFTQPSALVFLFGQPQSFFGKQLPPRDPNFQSGLFSGAAADEFRRATRSRFTYQIYGLYAQDQWQIASNFTLTWGLRYEVQTRPDDPDLAGGNFHTNDLNNVQPRIGLALSFNQGKGVVRGGFGIFNGQFPLSDLVQSGNGTAPIGIYLDNPLIPALRNPQQSLTGFGRFGPVGVAIPPLAAQAFIDFTRRGMFPVPQVLAQFPLGFNQRDFPDPYAQKASLQLEYAVAQDWFLGLGYQVVHALKLVGGGNINTIPIGTLPNGKTLFRPADFRFGFTILNDASGYSIFHAGMLSLRKSFSRHYSVLANYTFSKSIDNLTTLKFQGLSQDYYRPHLERALSDNHNQHRFNLALVADSPNQWPVALRDFTASVLLTAQSARFFSILTGFDVNGDNFPFSDRVGASGRNVYQGEPYFSMDLRVQRGIPFSEHLRGVFSVEFFNLLNVVNVLDLNTVYLAPDFIGPVPRKFGDGTRTPLPGFGSPRGVGSARQIQFAFRLSF